MSASDKNNSVRKVRLDRLLANMGYGSRRDVQRLVQYGGVTLDGVTLKVADQAIALSADLPSRLLVHDEPLDPLPGMVLMLHKPLGVTCSHKEKGALVYELFPERWQQRDPPLSTVGRLDKETSGLLLLTDDGALLHRLISPKSAITKRYYATLDRPLTGEEGALFASGTLMLDDDDKPLLPALLEPLTPTTAYVTLTEGRYHQVRRMFAAVGNHVLALHRDRIGDLSLPEDLAEGAYRFLDAADMKKLGIDAP